MLPVQSQSQEDAFFGSLQAWDEMRGKQAATASPTLADMLSEVQRQLPHETPGVKLAAAQAMVHDPGNAYKVLSTIGQASSQAASSPAQRTATTASQTMDPAWTHQTGYDVAGMFAPSGGGQVGLPGQQNAVWGQQSAQQMVGQFGNYASNTIAADQFNANTKQAMQDEIEMRVQRGQSRPNATRFVEAKHAEVLAKVQQSGVLPTDKLGDFTQAASRAVFGALQSPLQVMQTALSAQIQSAMRGDWTSVLAPYYSLAGAIATGANPISKQGSFAQLGESSTIGAAIGQAVAGQPVDLGKGYLPGAGSTEEFRHQQERVIAGTVPGTDQTATPGRLLASEVFAPQSKAYNLFSGLADAAIAWYADPAVISGRVYEGAKAAKGALTAADQSLYGASLVRLGEKITQEGGLPGVIRNGVFKSLADLEDEAWATRNELGIYAGKPNSLDPRRADNFLTTNDGLKLADSVAKDKNFLSIWHAFGGKLDLETAVALKDASTPAEVRSILRRELGTAITSQADIPALSSTYQAKRLASGSTFDYLQDRRIIGYLPTATIYANPDAPTIAKRLNISNLENNLVNAKVPFAKRSQIVEDFARALTDHSGAGAAKAVSAAENAIRESLVAHGVSNPYARHLTSYVADHGRMTQYGVDALGNGTDYNFLVNSGAAGRLQDQGFELASLEAHGPQLTSEGMATSFQLPEPRLIKRLTSPVGFITGKGMPNVPVIRALERVDEFSKGELRAPAAAIEYLQSLWKHAVVVRPAYLPRIIGEEQAAMAASGLSSVFRHPIDALMTASHNRAAFSILGEEFAHDLGLGEHTRDLLKGALNTVTADPTQIESMTYKSGHWAIASKVDHPRQYALGMGDEIKQLLGDPIARLRASGKSEDEIFNFLRSDDPGAVAAMKKIQAQGDAGITVPLTNGKTTKAYVDFAHDDTALRAKIQSIEERLNVKLGDNEALRQVVATGKIGTQEHVIDNSEIRGHVIKAGPVAPKDPFDPTAGTSTWVGSEVMLPGKGRAVIVNDAAEPGKSVIRLASDAFDEHGRQSAALRGAIDSHMNSEASPDKVKYNLRLNKRLDGPFRSEAQQRFHEALDSGMQKFFGWAYGKPSDYLTRSPAFRQFYARKAVDILPGLAPEEANRLIKTLSDLSDNLGGNVLTKFFGGNERDLDMFINAAKQARGTLTAEEADAYLKGFALDETRKLVHNTSLRGQTADTLRLVMPFGDAWAQFIKRWFNIIKDNPQTVRRLQQIIVGGKEFDPDGDGQGFFYTGPNGDLSFNYPLTDKMTEWMTGIPSPMRGSVQGLSVGLEVMPGLGPVAQILASNLIPDTPTFDTIREFMLPYGEASADLTDFAPSYLKKLADGITRSGTYEQTYGDVLRYLISTGKYGTSLEDRKRLETDAKLRAQILTVYRGLLQSVVPSAPQPGYVVHTQAGDRLQSGLATEWQKMQAANGGDTGAALDQFLQTYGDKAVGYTVAKSRALYGGLDASEQFGDWEREHPGVVSTYKDVGGYFAPVGTDFDFAVYDRQLRTGERRRLTGEEQLDAVNATLVRWKQRSAEEQLPLPPDRTPEQKQWLSDYKAELAKEYPQTAIRTYADVAPKINELELAASDSRLNDSPITEVLRDYMAQRQQALDAIRDRGGAKTLGAKANADFATWLSGLGEDLARKEPAFARVWDDVLSRELYQDPGATTPTTGTSTG